ncbi:hypothetical protein C8R44DRAFT_710359 [Mycena epipterygia]|nr:hypothetical protein C8R44DRAFT_710359 [Mycena epipterygia]
MLLSLGGSFARRPNGRIIIFACLSSYCGYYVGRQSLSGSSTSTQHEEHWPEPTLNRAQAVTVTVQVPQATVTVTTEVFVPRAEIEEPLLLNGAPTTAFQDNLRPDVQYITSWPGSGFTNDVMLFMNLIYLSLLTERVPIIPYFTPTHIAGGDYSYGPTIDFGEVFDVPRLQKQLGKPVLEWWQVKDRHSESVDPLGCWNVWQAVQTINKEPHWTIAPHRLKIDVSYTIAPTSIKLYPAWDHDPHTSFSALVALAFPALRERSLRTPLPSPVLKMSLPPDQHLLCFDNLYWASTLEPHEHQHDFSPSWRLVGKHLHWAPRIEELSRQYLRRAFGLGPTQQIPPYITVHVRHNDFGEWCGTVPLAECYAPLPVIARRLEEVRAEVALKMGIMIAVDRVVVTSDEKDPAWWDAALALGWVRIDHENANTATKHGQWYPFLVDAAIQSGGVGFVGTAESTVSLMAGKRVRAWQGGVVRMVKWGRVGADDH